MTAVGIEGPYDNLRLGYTENENLIHWYGVINEKFGTKGKARISYKIEGETKTALGEEEALEELKEGLRDEKKAYIVSNFSFYTILWELEFVLNQNFVKIINLLSFILFQK